jgi:hypothetical protein
MRGAASWSGIDGVRRFAGAVLSSENVTFPPVGVHVVSPRGMVTGRFPTSSVPVRVGSGVADGGDDSAV